MTLTFYATMAGAVFMLGGAVFGYYIGTGDLKENDAGPAFYSLFFVSLGWPLTVLALPLILGVFAGERVKKRREAAEQAQWEREKELAPARREVERYLERR